MRRFRLKAAATARDITDRKQFEREILEIVDREKERLGRELHDGLCQTLAGISALSSTLSRQLARSGDPASTSDGQTAAADAAAEITRLLNKAIGEARDMARGLGADGLSEDGLDRPRSGPRPWGRRPERRSRDRPRDPRSRCPAPVPRFLHIRMRSRSREA